jgi:chromosome segregation ATPase
MPLLELITSERERTRSLIETEEIQKLKSAIEQLRIQNAQAEDKYRTLGRENSSLANTVKGLEAQNASDKKKYDDQISELGQSMMGYKRALEEAQKLSEDLGRKLNENEGKLNLESSGYKKRISDLERENAEFGRNIGQLKSEIEGYNLRISALTQEKSQLESNLNSTTQQKNQLDSAWRGKYERLEREKAELAKEFEQYKQQGEKTMTRVNALLQDLARKGKIAIKD